MAKRHGEPGGVQVSAWIGLDARILAGGFKRGEDGVDNLQEIAHGRSTQLPTIAKAQP